MEIRAWLAKLPAGEKDDLLVRVIAGGTAVASEIIQRMRRERGSAGDTGKVAPKRRTVAKLLQEAERAADEHRRVAAERKSQEKARREREAADARARHLDKLAGSEPVLWKRVDDLIATKQPKRYDEAVGLLTDLRDLAARKDVADFLRRIKSLYAEHTRKSTLIERLQKAGL